MNVNPAVVSAARYLERMQANLVQVVRKEYPIGSEVAFEEQSQGRRSGTVISHSAIPGEILLRVPGKRNIKRLNVAHQPAERIGFATGE